MPMTSHEHAHKLREFAEALLKLPAFNLPSYQESYLKNHGIEKYSYHSDKDSFIAAVKQIGSGQKVVDGDDMQFKALDGRLVLTVMRNTVCRLVKEAEYECEPFLSQEEEAVLDGE